MKKYIVYFRAMLSNSLEYRGALLTWTVAEIVTLTSSLFLWSGIFSSNSQVGKYNFGGIVSYYFLLPIVGAFTTVFVSEHLPREIKDGQISTQIIKPYDFMAFKLINNAAIKITQMLLKLPIYFLVGILLLPKINYSVNYRMLPFFVIFCFCGYILHFSFDYALSLLAFWIEDTWSFSLLKQITILIFGGLAFPLSLVPDDFNWLFEFLPFKFIYYFPISVIQARFSFNEMMNSFIQVTIWISLFYYLGRLLWLNGLRKYGAYGQ